MAALLRKGAGKRGAEEIADAIDGVGASLAARADDPHQLAAQHFDNLLFGEEHPDGWVLTEELVMAISRRCVRMPVSVR